MNIIKQNWSKQEGKEFINYLESFQNKERILWTKNIVNTNMKVLAIKSPVLKAIVKELKQGNFISFLELKLGDYYENTVINAHLICSIRDFPLMKKYLDIYIESVDNWSSCDTLKFKVKGNEKEFYLLSLEYSKDCRPFVRRIGMFILFKLIENDEYLPKIFECLNCFKDEKEYYVNMVNAWLICECFIKRREETIEFLKTHQLNKFTINKAISKCRDSYRVCQKDKNMLLTYRCL